MLLFPNCKINIGLDILRKRGDGFHELETLMLPARDVCDILEIIPNDSETCTLHLSGAVIDCPPESNILTKTWQLMHSEYGIGGVDIYLHKIIPFGAGLGGGSADSAFLIRGLNELFSLSLSTQQMECAAAQLGSDNAMFITNKASMCSGRGEIITPSDIDLSGKWLLIVKPAVSISTAQAYAGVTPHIPTTPLAERLTQPIHTWQESIVNDFEAGLFVLYPELAEIKRRIIDAGALYASMSGSGSAMYGIFDHKPTFSATETETCYISAL